MNMAETLARWVELFIICGLDKRGNTQMAWFDDPGKEYITEETGEEVILMKDKAGRVIGFEKFNFTMAETELFQVAFEAMVV